MVVQLHREAAASLLKEARRELDNSAQELLSGREEHRAALDACTEIIGRLARPVERYWPQREDRVWGPTDRWDVDFDFSPTTLAWIERQRDEIAAYVEDLDRGVNITEPGDVAEQVYLAHVLRGIAGQREAVAA